MIAIIKYLFQLHLLEEEFVAIEVLDKWNSTWHNVAIKSELPDDTIVSYQKQGYHVLTTLIRRFADEIKVVNVNIPWKSTWDIFDVEVQGKAVALLAGAIDDESNTDFCIIDCLPPYVSARGTPAALEIYSLPREAVSREARKVTRDYRFKLQLIDPFTGDIKEVLPSRGNSQLPLIGVTLQQMATKLTLPNYQNHCRRCPYYKACDIKYLSNQALSHPKKTREELETKQGITYA